MSRRVWGQLELVLAVVAIVAVILAMQPPELRGIPASITDRHDRSCNVCPVAHVRGHVDGMQRTD
jgi:hypothetical protein